MKAKHWTAVITTALFLLNSSAVFAQGEGRGHGKDKQGDDILRAAKSECAILK